MTHQLSFHIHDVAPYINWVYFYYAWALGKDAVEERSRLRRDADDLMRRMDARYHTYTRFAILPAVSDGDDIIVDGTRMPMLRQQHVEADKPCLSLADFIRPAVADEITNSLINKIRREMLETKNITLTLKDSAVELIKSKAQNNLENGGRGIGNIIEEYLINPLSRHMFARRITRDAEITINDITSDNGIITLVCA